MEGNNLPRRRILLAEDNRTNQMTAVRMLEKLGHQVDVAVNGTEAVEACRQFDYGIVLMDNQMPEMDGLTATRNIRQFEQAHGKPRVPIIALTANAMRGDREMCLAAGMDDYISKPFKAAQLSEMIERWGQGAPSPSVALGQDDVPAAHQEKAIDSRVFDDFRGTGGGANDFVNSLIDQYLTESALRSAELLSAVGRRDAPALRLAAHSLRGNSSAVGATRLAAICAELEQLARSPTLDGASALAIAFDDEFARVRHALEIERGRADHLVQ